MNIYASPKHGMAANDISNFTPIKIKVINPNNRVRVSLANAIGHKNAFLSPEQLDIKRDIGLLFQAD